MSTVLKAPGPSAAKSIPASLNRAIFAALFEPIRVGEEKDRRRARTVAAFSLVHWLFIGVSLLFGILSGDASLRPHVALIAISFVILGCVYGMARLGSYRIAAMLEAATTIGSVFWAANGNVTAVAIPFAFPWLTVAVLLTGLGGSAAMVALSSGLCLFGMIALAVTHGNVPVSVFVNAGLPVLACGVLKVVTTVVSTHDLRQLRETQEVARVNERLLKEFSDHSPSAIFSKDLEGRYTLANKHFQDMMGLSRDQIIGRIDAELFPLLTAEVLRDNDARVIATAQSHLFEETVHESDGPRIFMSQKFPLFDRSGRLCGIGGLSTDITNIRRLEDEVKSHQEKLAAAAKLSAIGEMASALAHEINNPLMIIHGGARHAKMFLADTPPRVAEAIENANLILKTVGRISKIIAGLKAFARNEPEIDSRKLESAAALLDDALNFCCERFRNHGIDLQIECGDRHLKVYCNGIQISQVLLNLLNNAFDAVEHQTNPWVRVSIEDKGDDIEIAVMDSGSGVPPEVRQKLFLPFFTTKPVGRGTGIGLSVSVGIISSHGGVLAIDDASPNTRFFFRLPKCYDGAPNAA